MQGETSGLRITVNNAGKQVPRWLHIFLGDGVGWPKQNETIRVLFNLKDAAGSDIKE